MIRGGTGERHTGYFQKDVEKYPIWRKGRAIEARGAIGEKRVPASKGNWNAVEKGGRGMEKVWSVSIWGDSIGKGIVYDEERGRYAICRENLAARLKREAGIAVENHSVMGYTVLQAAEKFDESSLRPGGVAALEFGGNDCDMDWKAVSEAPDEEHDPRTPLKVFTKTLSGLVEKVRKGGMLPVLVVPPPIDAERYFRWVSKNLNPKAILQYLGDVQHIYRWQERYALAVRDLARKMGCKALDLRDAFLASRDFKELICVDGIHPTEAGYHVIWEAVNGVLCEARG